MTSGCVRGAGTPYPGVLSGDSTSENTSPGQWRDFIFQSTLRQPDFHQTGMLWPVAHAMGGGDAKDSPEVTFTLAVSLWLAEADSRVGGSRATSL
ncbi:hypothetical protein D623_10002684 [Myotis brandtii]|uniref:Uncharacterized protein n=1 Tax=Myotis brandtii TaxID=109478 RepID=S7PEC4_MYOBR|nr:hypothetical protein D623_10002684 [Myotis brandtii]